MPSSPRSLLASFVGGQRGRDEFLSPGLLSEIFFSEYLPVPYWRDLLHWGYPSPIPSRGGAPCALLGIKGTSFKNLVSDGFSAL
jgi:hypothetical protein